MTKQYQIVISHRERHKLTLEATAAAVGLHPETVKRFIEYGLIEPVEQMGAELLFDVAAVPRIRAIERLRRDLGVNLPGIAIILDLVERVRALQSARAIQR